MYPYGGGGSSVTEPVYVNGETYVIEGVTVTRSNNKWLYYSRYYGWTEVVLKNGTGFMLDSTHKISIIKPGIIAGFFYVFIYN